MPITEFRTPRLEVPRLGKVPASPTQSPSRALAGPSLPARARPECASPAVEIATSHVETLIERVTGVDKAVPDNHGDYPLRFRDSLCWVRVVNNEGQPVVRVFSHVLSDLAPSFDLYEAVNKVNTRLTFCRCYYVEECVVIETDHLGLTIRTDDFRELTQNVAAASVFFGSMLNERFGGKLPFDGALHDDEIEPAAMPLTGLYL